MRERFLRECEILPNHRRQGHGHTNANSRALHSCDGRLPASMNSQNNASATTNNRISTDLRSTMQIVESGMKAVLPISMIGSSVLLNMAVEANIEISTGTKDLAGTSEYNDFDSFVDVEHGEELLEVLDHLSGEGIVVGRTVQCHDHDWGHSWRAGWMMGNQDMAGCRHLFVGVWKVQGLWVEDHLD